MADRSPAKPDTVAILRELNRAKVLFQRRALLLHLSLNPDAQQFEEKM